MARLSVIYVAFSLNFIILNLADNLFDKNLIANFILYDMYLAIIFLISFNLVGRYIVEHVCV